jgi:hypothetical protein
MSAGAFDRKRLLAVAAGLTVAGVIAALWLAWGREVGTLRVAATLTGGRGISGMTYAVTGNGLPATTGKVTFAGHQAAVFTVKNLPPADGYSIEIAAATPDGHVRCSRRASFDVFLEETTQLDLAVLCRDLRVARAFAAARQPAGRELTAVAPALPAPEIEVPPECTACEQQHIASGACEPDSGCDGLQGEDRQLCVDLVNCMRATNCWIRDPLDCLCGTVDYVACTRVANGACRAEMQAATRTTDPLKNGTLFYDPSVPAGRANRLISCDREKCRAHCSL